MRSRSPPRWRFSRLLESLLRLHGHQNITIIDAKTDPVPPSTAPFDHVIETTLDGTLLARMIDLVRPRGLIVLKSRHVGVLPLDIQSLLRKQITVRGVNYGSFRKAVGLLVEGQLPCEEWFGPTFPLDQFGETVARDERGEAAKLFLSPGTVHVRNRC
jgi:threonine dehydrogenase-like Zn-dependent dehydrogenase